MNDTAAECPLHAPELYVFAQQPVTTDGVIVPVQAVSVDHAVIAAAAIIGPLIRKVAGHYEDGQGRRFLLFYGPEGVEQLGRSIRDAGLPLGD